MTKVQLTLTSQEAAILTGYGEQFGYNLTKTIKFLLSKTAETVVNDKNSTPIFKMSPSTEQVALQALKDYKRGKTKPLEDIDVFLDSL